MITVKEAAQKAKEYLLDLMPELEDALIQIEETEKSDTDNAWLITLGINEKTFVDELTGPPPFDIYDRKKAYYKIFRVNRETGDVESMKIREVG